MHGSFCPTPAVPIRGEAEVADGPSIDTLVSIIHGANSDRDAPVMLSALRVLVTHDSHAQAMADAWERERGP